MMLYPAMNRLLEEIPSRYKLVNVVAARARQIATEAKQEKISLEDKPVTLAVREIADGNLPEEFWCELSENEETEKTEEIEETEEDEV